MSHNSYRQRLNDIYADSSKKELEVRSERHFTIDDIEVEKKYKWHLLLLSFVLGVITATLILHFWK
jgi:Uri superfamily endonuclease